MAFVLGYQITKRLARFLKMPLRPKNQGGLNLLGHQRSSPYWIQPCYLPFPKSVSTTSPLRQGQSLKGTFYSAKKYIKI